MPAPPSTSPGTNCPAKFVGDLLEPMKYSKGKWTVGKPVPTAGNPTLVIDGKLYMVAFAMYRLDQPDGEWKLLSYAPVAKVLAGVAVVYQ